jgi:hypothetical protein
MSFTEDELQAFNKILDQRLSAHRRDMERVFEQRMTTLRRDLEQRLATTRQEVARMLAQKFSEEHQQFNTGLKQQLQLHQVSLVQAVNQHLEQQQQQQQQQFAELIESTLAAQLLAIEELISQRIALPSTEDTTALAGEQPPQFETIEVQTELPWEDLMDIFGKALDERFVLLNASVQSAMQTWEQYLSHHLQTLQAQLRDELARQQAQRQNGNGPSMSAIKLQDMFQGIQQLEHIIESMQVAMTTNHALLSNRLYHHQQLPLERAHPGSQPSSNQPGGVTGQLPDLKDRESQ